MPLIVGSNLMNLPKPPAKCPHDYAKLAATFMPRPLHDEVDYHNALGILDSMAGFKLNSDPEDYLDAIATFVEKYEAEHHSISNIKMKPLGLIQSLMAEHRMNASDLGRL